MCTIYNVISYDKNNVISACMCTSLCKIINGKEALLTISASQVYWQLPTSSLFSPHDRRFTGELLFISCSVRVFKAHYTLDCVVEE